MTPLHEGLRRAAAHLAPQRDAIVESWARALLQEVPASREATHARCARELELLLERLSRGELEAYLADEAAAAAERARSGAGSDLEVRAIRAFDRCCLPFVLAACPEREALAECLLALDELADRRLEALLKAQEEESARRLAEAQDRSALAEERAAELQRTNEALRRSEARGQHRAEQIALLSSVAHRLAGILDPERLMEEAAQTIQARMGHTYVAVVVLDHEGVLVGRWAGRPGVARNSAGRTQGPPGGVIGRAIRKRAPQVVPDVSRDPEYHADVPGTRSEMAIPLIEGGQAIGAMDFQSERPAAFDLDDVVAAEVLAEFLIVAFRNARLFAEARGPK